MRRGGNQHAAKQFLLKSISNARNRNIGPVFENKVLVDLRVKSIKDLDFAEEAQLKKDIVSELQAITSNCPNAKLCHLTRAFFLFGSHIVNVEDTAQVEKYMTKEEFLAFKQPEYEIGLRLGGVDEIFNWLGLSGTVSSEVKQDIAGIFKIPPYLQKYLESVSTLPFDFVRAGGVTVQLGESDDFSKIDPKFMAWKDVKKEDYELVRLVHTRISFWKDDTTVLLPRSIFAYMPAVRLEPVKEVTIVKKDPVSSPSPLTLDTTESLSEPSKKRKASPEGNGGEVKKARRGGGGKKGLFSLVSVLEISLKPRRVKRISTEALFINSIRCDCLIQPQQLQVKQRSLTPNYWETYSPQICELDEIEWCQKIDPFEESFVYSDHCHDGFWNTFEEEASKVLAAGFI
jgi:hypothetical protein